MRGARFASLAVMLAVPAGAQAPCAKAKSAATEFYVEIAPKSPRDSLVRGRLCLTSGKTVGSFMATLTYDSSRARLSDFRLSDGMGSANTSVPGMIRIAAAGPNGFSSALIATMVFRPAASRSLERVDLSVTEVTTTAGASLLANTRTTGWPANQVATRRPSVDSIRPRSGEIEHERVTDLTIYGRNFAVSGNTVDFGGAAVADLSSERGGTIIRFSAPTLIPVPGSQEMGRVPPGRIAVRVRTAGGTSNAVVFMVRGSE